MENVCKNVFFSGLTGSFQIFSWNDSAYLPPVGNFVALPATTKNLLSQSSSSHNLDQSLEFFSTANNLRNFWRSKIQQVSTHKFSSRDDIITQKRNYGSFNTLLKRPESPSTLLTKTSKQWNLSSRVLEEPSCNIFFVRHENWRLLPASKTDQWYLQIQRVIHHGLCQVNVNTMQKIFQQRSELQVTKGLIVHGVSSSREQ